MKFRYGQKTSCRANAGQDAFCVDGIDLLFHHDSLTTDHDALVIGCYFLAEVGRLKSTEATMPRFFEKSSGKNSKGFSSEDLDAALQRLASLLNLDSSAAKPIGTKGKTGATSKKNQSADSPLEKSLFDDIKPRRNDPCPCGSGKKYKNCCGK